VLNRHETSRFCTVVLARLRRRADNGSWELTVSCGGHPLPLLARGSADPEPVGRPGSLLGVLDEVELHDVTVALGSGDEVLMMTDGVTEARRGTEWFGDSGVRSAMAAHAGSAESVADGVLADVLEFQRGQARDDIALVVLRVP
jgi:phosphoserine phosphatase RsbU/P